MSLNKLKFETVKFPETEEVLKNKKVLVTDDKLNNYNHEVYILWKIPGTTGLYAYGYSPDQDISDGKIGKSQFKLI